MQKILQSCNSLLILSEYCTRKNFLLGSRVYSEINSKVLDDILVKSQESHFFYKRIIYKTFYMESKKYIFDKQKSN